MYFLLFFFYVQHASWNYDIWTVSLLTIYQFTCLLNRVGSLKKSKFNGI